MNESYREIVGKEISDLIDKYESQNKNNKQATNKLYVHVVPKEINDHGHDMYYVGITSRTLSARSGVNGKEYEGPHFRPAIDKYGWSAMKHDVISDRLLRNEAEELEVKLIAYLKSSDGDYGYNCAPGGLGGNQKETFPIKQFTLWGKYITTYDSAAEAARAVNAPRGAITDAAKKLRTSHGYIWRYANTCGDEIDVFEKIFKYSVRRIDKNGNVSEYVNPNSAAKRLNITNHMVHTYVTQRVTDPTGAQWYYIDSDLREKYSKKKEEKLCQAV